jgi:hypothetical protein
MSGTIVVLDDEPERIDEMTRCLSARLPNHKPVVFDNAPDLIAWIGDQLSDVQLICLDHDLGPNRRRGDEVFDPGTGRDVADFLAKCQPVCPVVIHTTNSMAAPGMTMVLDDAGWQNIRVIPYNDLEWIGADWINAVASALGTA